MRRSSLLLLAIVPLLAAVAGERYATWDKLFIKPDAPLAAISDEGSLTLLVYHQYPTPLHNLRAEATSEVLTFAAPATLATMPPTEIHSLKLTAKRRGQTTRDVSRITVTLSADELAEPTTWQTDLPLTRAGERLANDPLTMPAGEVQVMVVRSSKGTYLAQIGIALLLLGWWLVRKRDIARHERPVASASRR